MSKTPWTDAATFSPSQMRLSKTIGMPVEVVDSVISRQLETELAEARDHVLAIRNAALPDPHDERDIDVDWLRKVIFEHSQWLQEQEK